MCEIAAVVVSTHKLIAAVSSSVAHRGDIRRNRLIIARVAIALIDRVN